MGWFNGTEVDYETAEMHKYNTNTSQLNGKENGDNNNNDNNNIIQIRTILS